MNNKIESIQILGSGCSTCWKLYELTQEAAKQLGLSVLVEYINDIQKILDLGVMSSPVLAVNGQPVLAGGLPTIEKIKELLNAGRN